MAFAGGKVSWARMPAHSAWCGHTERSHRRTAVGRYLHCVTLPAEAEPILTFPHLSSRLPIKDKNSDGEIDASKEAKGQHSQL